ncbi:MAG: GNAT family N-acetyltransferase [Candidatus Heimdallarchaeota archaeon]
MQTYQIKKCSRKDIPAFTTIICKTFNDKYPFFFKGLPEKEYISLVTDLNLLAYDKFGNSNKYLLFSDNTAVGALEIYTERKQNLPLGSTIKILRKKYRFLKSLKTSIMLLGFGPPFSFPQKTLFIDKVGILEEHQRKGHGKKLLDFAIDKAVSDNLSNILLDVIDQNKGAIALYEKIGFKIINTSSTYLGGIFLGISKYHRMRKRL